MSFEEFKSKRGKFTPQVTINKAGGIGLTSGMHHRYNIDNYAGAKLYFDRETRMIGIKLVENIGEGVFVLKKRENQKGAYFSAYSFWQAYNVNPEIIKGRYTPEETEDPVFGKLFVVQLPPPNNHK